MNSIQNRLLPLLFGAAMALPCLADDAGHTTKDIQWGEHWSGPKMKRAGDLKGKVVLLKIWGG